jgi:hypothetical protein
MRVCEPPSGCQRPRAPPTVYAPNVVGALTMTVSFASAPSLRVRVSFALAASVRLALTCAEARADGTSPTVDRGAASAAPVPGQHADDAVSIAVRASVVPPVSEHAYIQFGVALSAELVAFAGPACSDTVASCILGSGGGVVARAGWRRSETWYIGGAYEMSKQDPHQLYRLALLQQVRAELRRYFPTGRDTSPFLLLGGGLGAYGNEWWPIDTWGPSATVGGGLEVQLGGSVLVVSLAYRPMYFHGWTDSSTLTHDSGVAHFVVLEAAVEQQDTP